MVKNDSNFYKDNPDWENSYMEIHFLNFTSRARNSLKRNSVKWIFKFCLHDFFLFGLNFFYFSDQNCAAAWLLLVGRPPPCPHPRPSSILSTTTFSRPPLSPSVIVVLVVCRAALSLV